MWDAFEDIFGPVIDLVEDLVGVIIEGVEDIGCGVFASIAVDGYLAASPAFDELNSGSNKDVMTYAEKYYTAHLYGDLIKDVRINLDTVFPTLTIFGHQVWEWDSAGVTFGKTIYLKSGYSTPSGQQAQLNHVDPRSASFEYSTKLVIHEMKHVQQESDYGFDPVAFGWQYMYGYCKVCPPLREHCNCPKRDTDRFGTSQAGFSYEDNVFEAEAYADQEFANGILFNSNSNNSPSFERYWYNNTLFTLLGFPSELTTHRGNGSGFLSFLSRILGYFFGTTVRFDALHFDSGGVMAVQTNNTDCWVYYTAQEWKDRVNGGAIKPWLKKYSWNTC